MKERNCTMPTIKLTSGFTLIPEGTHIFKITDAKYNEEFGKLEIHMQTRKGQKHIERYALTRDDGTINEGAYNAFSYLAKVALQNFDLDEIDPVVLIGRYIECDVAHEVVPNKKKPGQTVTFIHLTEKRESDGWGDAPAVVPPNKTSVDLAALLS